MYDSLSLQFSELLMQSLSSIQKGEGKAMLNKAVKH